MATSSLCCHSLVLGSLYVYSSSFLFSPMLPHVFICFFIFFLPALLTFQIPEPHLVFFCHKIKYVGTFMLFVDSFKFFSCLFFSFLFKSYSFHGRKCFLLYICIVPCTRRPLSAAASSISDRTNNKNSDLIFYMNI